MLTTAKSLAWRNMAENLNPPTSPQPVYVSWGFLLVLPSGPVSPAMFELVLQKPEGDTSGEQSDFIIWATEANVSRLTPRNKWLLQHVSIQANSQHACDSH